MALVKCRECGGEVSTEARACPKCGARIKRALNWPAITLAAAVGVTIGALALFLEGPPQTPDEAAARSAEAARRAAAEGVVRGLRDLVRDPDSMVVEQALVSEAGDVVCVRYRARNGFGGMNRELAVLTPDGAGTDAAAWSRHCTGAMHDELRSVRFL